MIWSRSEQWMLTGDDKGYIKYWQTNMNNVKMFQGHIEAIRGLRYKNKKFLFLTEGYLFHLYIMIFTLMFLNKKNKKIYLSIKIKQPLDQINKKGFDHNQACLCILIMLFFNYKIFDLVSLQKKLFPYKSQLL